MRPSVLDVYQRYIWKGDHTELAEYLFSHPPVKMGSIAEKARSILEGYSMLDWHSPDRAEITRKVLLDTNKGLGALTPKVKESIERLQGGAVEAAHQSVVMGGPCYILNKAATAVSVANIGSEVGVPLSPLFFVADYDIVQPELTNIRTPNEGQSGNLVSLPYPKDYEFSPVSVIPLPGKEWLEQTEDDIRSSYRPLMKSLATHARMLVEERLEQALLLVRWAYHNSETLGEWSQRVIGRLLNIEGDLGVPLLTASEPRIRKLMTDILEMLLARDNRASFLAAHDAASVRIREHGFKTGIGSRDHNYVPFLYECPGKDCHSARIELSYEVIGSIAQLAGKCPRCGDNIVIEVNAEKPDLSDISGSLSLRVDIRQIATDTLLPVVAHIGGPGETAYYAQVIPAARELGIPFPAFIKYPRVYFNTPWNEELGKLLREKGVPVLHDSEFFSATGKIGRFRKKKRHYEMNSMIEAVENIVSTTHAELNSRHNDLEERRVKGEAKSDDSLLTTKLEVERYLSWVYGQFAEGKLSQESAWSWIEWAINSGFSDLFGPYFRAYTPEMKNGATLFVNFTL
ncbi:MAG: bacillithiol biosynthesis BshC [Candidatus Thorarchaeota archaeon]